METMLCELHYLSVCELTLTGTSIFRRKSFHSNPRRQSIPVPKLSLLLEGVIYQCARVAVVHCDADIFFTALKIRIFLPHPSSFRLILPVSTLPMPPASKNPLELPEIIQRMSRYVATNDAVSCAQVCKAWSDHFISAIWHTIDFDVHYGLVTLDTRVLPKYGHHIREVNNVYELGHIVVLAASEARELKRVSIVMSASQVFYAFCIDILRRVNTTLEHIKILQPTEDAVPYFAVDSLFPATSTGATSRLSYIKMEGLTMTRHSLSSLLANCPCLDRLYIRSTTLLSWPTQQGSGVRSYQHTGVTELTAPVEQIFKPDQQHPNAPSLFVHFPNLTAWRTLNSGPTDPIEIPIKDIRDEIARYCPWIEMLCLETRAPLGISLLGWAFQDLTSIGVLNEHLSLNMVMAILKHKETLNHLYTTEDGNIYLSETIPEVESNQLGANGCFIQSLPQHCTQLRTLMLPLFEMDMDDIEMMPWECHDLIVLYIRIQGLNTKERIDRSIQLWKEGRERVNIGQDEFPSAALQLHSVIPQDDESIEARVARHLVKFKKLREVWLGWKIHEVA